MLVDKEDVGAFVFVNRNAEKVAVAPATRTRNL